MTTIFLITSIVCGGFLVATTITFLLSVLTEDPCYWMLISAVGFGLTALLSLDLFQKNVKQESKEIVITTSMPAKIDTTIVITNGVSDTTYTYHLIEK